MFSEDSSGDELSKIKSMYVPKISLTKKTGKLQKAEPKKEGKQMYNIASDPPKAKEKSKPIQQGLAMSTLPAAARNALQRRIDADTVTYTCSTCKRKFQVKSLYNAHMLNHAEAKRSSSSRVGTNRSKYQYNEVPIEYQCSYCDRYFALERALHIHLKHHCTRIPLPIRRTLEIAEDNHVGKSKLPDVFNKPPTVYLPFESLPQTPINKLAHLIMKNEAAHNEKPQEKRKKNSKIRSRNY